ncbi:MAG: beta-N-acetylglucosaminidase (EC [uncultured Paraburkholderia sp.]|nr:MAG: beta-N-acetylglucosaminidase (EC [uncultured Paraburkholderia sp.]CAH2937102.1 MAG: beta-N-acetylglucosaminidase (EC [uncultured Paraburkholderia sp.]
MQAGCDMVLICNQLDEAEKVLDALRFMPSKESQRRIKAHAPGRRAAQVEQAGCRAALSAGAGFVAQYVCVSLEA